MKKNYVAPTAEHVGYKEPLCSEVNVSQWGDLVPDEE